MASTGMASTLPAVVGSTARLVKITRALLSVSDKTGLEDLGKFLAARGVELLSTGGTASRLRAAGLAVLDVSEYTESPEILDGRVKSLHPKIHGGILAVRGNEAHAVDMVANGIKPIDLVVLNLYPFRTAVTSGGSFLTCMENIDIGGPAMLRAAAKNHRSVVVVQSPSQYQELMSEIMAHDGATGLELRTRFASAAFAASAAYDSTISAYFASPENVTRHRASDSGDELEAAASVPSVVTRAYHHAFTLKYGCNPHQKPASIMRVGSARLPFEILNGVPGYINLCDAVNAWQLVHELRSCLPSDCGPAAASFKHVSPAGAAVAAVPLTDAQAESYEVPSRGLSGPLSPAALAYIRARNADPMSSFGDFVALSDEVDEQTALVLKTEVSDGIIAPGYSTSALAILKRKKGGRFIILKADPAYVPPEVECREIFGMGFLQKRNTSRIDEGSLFKKLVGQVASSGQGLSASAKRDLILASITVKYTQSNSVGFAADGQMVGVGAGQQSRVDCVKLAGRKVAVWHLRHHPKVRALKFRKGVKRQARINARVRYIEGDFTAEERVRWEAMFENVPEKLTNAEKESFMQSLSGVSLSSDAFFPFRDSIDHAAKYGVTNVIQPGGSVADDDVIAACDEYGMNMAFSGIRLFHH